MVQERMTMRRTRITVTADKPEGDARQRSTRHIKIIASCITKLQDNRGLCLAHIRLPAVFSL